MRIWRHGKRAKYAVKDSPGYRVKKEDIALMDVDRSWSELGSAPEGANIVAVNGIKVSSWDE